MRVRPAGEDDETEGQDRENENNQEEKVESVRTSSYRRELVAFHSGSLRPRDNLSPDRESGSNIPDYPGFHAINGKP